MAIFWDVRHDVEVYTISGISAIDFQRANPARYCIETASSEPGLDVLFHPGSSSDTLVVSLQGALGRGQTMPRFERFRSLSLRQEHLLFICDTSLRPERDVFLAWYFGTEEFDLQKSIAEFITEFASRLGVRQVVICGSSGGGFASLMIGQQVDGSVALAFDPQIRPALWGAESFVQNIWSSGKYWREFEQTFPLRLSFIELLASRFPRMQEFQIVQNIGDHHHMTYHLPLVTEYIDKIDPSGDIYGRCCRIALEDYGTGHKAPPVPLFNRWLDSVVSY